MKSFTKVSRILLVIASLSVALTYYLPLWEIKLWAPQYPEGLSIEIWHNNVKGDVEIINGLNHYIGMRHIKKEMFPEFLFLKYIIAAFMLWGIFVAWKGQMKWLWIYCSSIVVGGIVALTDFYRWGYDYGHNLDPTAPIQVPGMAYQPPVLGYKTLLNFVALSVPSAGGWIIIGVGVLAFVILALELFKRKKPSRISPFMLLFVTVIGFSSCMKIQPSINFGKDDCDHCRMKMMDNRFGFAVVTDKGRTYKFDDLNCLKGFKKENQLNLAQEYAVSFDKPGVLTDAATAFFIQSAEITSPMGSGVAAFSNQEACKLHEHTFHASCVTYTSLMQNN